MPSLPAASAEPMAIDNSASKKAKRKLKAAATEMEASLSRGKEKKRKAKEPSPPAASSSDEDRSSTSSEEPAASAPAAKKAKKEKDKSKVKAVADEDDDDDGELTARGDEDPADPNALSNFRISEPLRQSLKSKGIKALFPIQATTFDLVLDGSDLVGRARTGQGKTLAFVLPILESLVNGTHKASRRTDHGRPPSVLVLLPTRELAKQVHSDFAFYGATFGLSSCCVYGGSEYRHQEISIRRGVDIIVGTPGRVKDFIVKGTLNLKSLKFRVLDEADEMLNMGFVDDVELILGKVEDVTKVQTLLFSATMPAWVNKLSLKFLKSDKKTVDLVGDEKLKASASVRHLALPCNRGARAQVIPDIIRCYSRGGRTIIFTETKESASELSGLIAGSRALHGDVVQAQREVILAGFRSGKFLVLVATNVAARGLDINDVQLIIQCEPPRDVEAYIHRSGRTGRAALFHKKHFKVPRGAANAIYVCNKCLAEKDLRVKSPQKKAVSKKTSPKKKQSRKTVTRRNQIVVKFKKKSGMKKGKCGRPRKNPLNMSKNESLKMPEKGPSNEPKNEPVKRISKRLYDKYMKGNSNVSERAASCRKRKRTALHYSYWLNGLRWTQNPDDEQARSFRKESVVFPSEDVEISEVSPVCCLCEKCYSGEAIYIACGKCEDWFHGDIYSVTLENVNNIIDFKCHRCRLRGVPVCPYAQIDTILKARSDREDSIKRSVEDEDHNCPKDLGAHDGLKELHDDSVEKELNSHSIVKQVGNHTCLEVLEDHNNLKELDSHSTKKELEDCNYLKELDNHINMNELDSHSTEKGLHDHNCLKELDDHNNLNELDSHTAEKELDGHNCLNELDNHNSVKELDNQNSPEEFDSTDNSKFAAGETQGLKDLENYNSLKDLDNYNSLEELDDHHSPKELDNHNSLEELDNLNSPKDLDNHKSPKELDCTEDSEFDAVTHTDDFLDEQFNIRMSGKDALIMTSESGSVKESIALQSKDSSEENYVAAEHEVDLQVVVTL